MHDSHDHRRPTIAICGSMAFLDEMEQIACTLSGFGCEALTCQCARSTVSTGRDFTTGDARAQEVLRRHSSEQDSTGRRGPDRELPEAYGIEDMSARTR